MFKKAIVKKWGRVIKINNRFFLDWSLKEYGVDENIEKFLKVLFEGLY